MSGVTVRACCSDGEAALQQPFAVDALRVVRDDFVLCTRVANRGLFALTVTAPAQIRDIRWERYRDRVTFPKHVVCPVALLTAGGILIISGQQLAMLAALELLPHFFVT